MILSPIQTKYKGILFRSRLEARYAFLFDYLDIKWEYELDGFKIGGEWYLPDFYLPNVGLRTTKTTGVFFEVKPSLEKAEEKESIFNNFDGSLVVACGTPLMEEEWLYEWHKDRWDNFMLFMYCPKCSKWKIEYDENNYRFCESCGQQIDLHSKWPEAISIMRSYRFGSH